MLDLFGGKKSKNHKKKKSRSYRKSGGNLQNLALPAILLAANQILNKKTERKTRKKRKTRKPRKNYKK